MVSLRLITFVSLFVLLHVTQGGMSKVELAADEIGQPPIPRRNPVKVEKEIYDGVPSAVAELVHHISGRKMTMSKRILGKVKEEGSTLNNINGERRLKKISGGHRRPVKVKIAGFIPLNADYHVPKPHPPKNN